MRKPYKGEKLFIVQVDRYGNGVKEYQAEVIIVGRKYFTVQYNKKQKMLFFIKTWRENTEYPSRVTLWETEQEYRDKIEVNRLNRIIKDKFSYGNILYTLDQLRQVIKILEG